MTDIVPEKAPQDVKDVSLADDKNPSYERDQVVKIINSVITKVEHVEEDQREAVYAGLTNLKRVIDEARKEVGIANPRTISETHIPTATDELDAIVEATAEATGTIMDACDAIGEAAAAAGGEHGDKINEEVMKIYEACSFQDITGQRVTKVVKTLHTIEEKIDTLMEIIGNRLPGMDESVAREDEDTRVGDERLLNGPQLPDQAISQEEIDKLLEEFD